MTVQPADARRNYVRILAVAEEEVAAHGADASLKQIARTAGVGSATVRRHFPGRRALLEAVFKERIEALCVRAAELSGAAYARATLLEWLGALTTYAASARGTADAVAPGVTVAERLACTLSPSRRQDGAGGGEGRAAAHRPSGGVVRRRVQRSPTTPQRQAQAAISTRFRNPNLA